MTSKSTETSRCEASSISIIPDKQVMFAPVPVRPRAKFSQLLFCEDLDTCEQEQYDYNSQSIAKLAHGFRRRVDLLEKRLKREHMKQLEAHVLENGMGKAYLKRLLHSRKWNHWTGGGYCRMLFNNRRGKHDPFIEHLLRFTNGDMDLATLPPYQPPIRSEGGYSSSTDSDDSDFEVDHDIPVEMRPPPEPSLYSKEELDREYTESLQASPSLQENDQDEMEQKMKSEAEEPDMDESTYVFI